MRIARFELEGAVRVGVAADDQVRPLAPDTDPVAVLIAGHDERARLLDAAEPPVALADVRLLAPLVPASIRDFSVFEQHVEGLVKRGAPDRAIPPFFYETPFFYFSNPHAVVGSGEAVALPPRCVELDFELEVAAIIGRPGRNLTVAEAADHIAGYTIFNDWSARDLQAEEMAMGLGVTKGKDFASTLGPWIVTADELASHLTADGALDLDLRVEVNGRPHGDDTLAAMAWTFPELVAYASRGAWIAPDDVIGSGTCGQGCLAELWGRRYRLDPPPLRAGDTVTMTVEGIGTIANTIVPGVDPVLLPPARRVVRRHAMEVS
jgi:2-keto-4-pentenoate hydratase/2-oxohepta-3-ene-1,7-dioic acid hydratase in catechol pathway